MNEQAPTPNQPSLEEQRLAAFERVAAFAANPSREFAAGPDIRQATGLGHTEVNQLGYGSYADLEHDAVAWKTEQVREEERVAARDEHRRRGAEQAKLWQNDIDAYRAERDKADKVVDELTTRTIENVKGHVAHQEAAKISYRDRLNGLGSIGDSRDPVNAARRKVEAAHAGKAKAEAIFAENSVAAETLQTSARSAAEAWATANKYSTGHMKTSHFEVPRNEAAEQRTSELAAALKAHDAELLTASSKRAQGGNTVVDPADAPDSPDVDRAPAADGQTPAQATPHKRPRWVAKQEWADPKEVSKDQRDAAISEWFKQPAAPAKNHRVRKAVVETGKFAGRLTTKAARLLGRGAVALGNSMAPGYADSTVNVRQAAETVQAVDAEPAAVAAPVLTGSPDPKGQPRVPGTQGLRLDQLQAVVRGQQQDDAEHAQQRRSA